MLLLRFINSPWHSLNETFTEMVTSKISAGEIFYRKHYLDVIHTFYNLESNLL
jgi:hypothetical protein